MDYNDSMVMPVAPMYGGNGYGGSNGGFFDNSLWIIILFLFLIGGWGNGGGFGSGNTAGTLYPWMNQMETTQSGFNQAAVSDALAGIQTSLTAGFSNAEVARCSAAMDAMQTAYTNQIASMNQNFANQQALNAQLNGISSALQSCCCENRASTADLKYVVATEACADRAAVTSALRDVLEANSASTQRILDQLCADKIDAKNEKIAELQNQLNIANMQASQVAQTSRILADNAAQTVALEQYLNPTPIPAYLVQNPSCCGSYNYGCGCSAIG